MKVSPSILAAPLTRLGETLGKCDAKVIDFIHLDVMDGHFVPAITFGEQVAAAVKSETKIPLDVHLMVSRPEVEVPKYFHLKPFNITFHIEATNFSIRLIQQIQNQGIKAGIALNPSTPIESLRPVIAHLDLVLLMTVEPGFYGQKFIEGSLERLTALKKLADEKGRPDLIIELDGGINDKNIKAIAQAGCSMVVAGSYVFKAEDYNKQVQTLKDFAN